MGVRIARLSCGLALGVLGAVIMFATPTSAQETTVLRVEGARIDVGETVALDVVLIAPRGLQTFDITLAVADARIAAFQELRPQAFNSQFFKVVEQSEGAIRFKGVDLDNQIQPGTQAHDLARLTLLGVQAGRTEIEVTVHRFVDEEGVPLQIATESGPLEVVAEGGERPPPSGPPPIGDSPHPPRDLDGDGLFEDVNGDGRFTADDVALFALHLQSETVQRHEDAFDFNGDGRVDEGDAFALAALLDVPRAEGTALELEGGGTVAYGERTVLTLRLLSAPDGLRAYRLRLSVADGDARLALAGARSVAIDPRFVHLVREGKADLEIRAADIADAVRPGAQDVVLAEVEVLGTGLGRAEVRIDVVAMTDDRGRPLRPLVRSPLLVEIVPAGPPPLGDSPAPPRDLDGDGLFEDVDGDGTLTSADVILLALHLNRPEVQENVAFFDFNGDGAVDFADVQALQTMVEAERT